MKIKKTNEYSQAVLPPEVLKADWGGMCGFAAWPTAKSDETAPVYQILWPLPPAKCIIFEPVMLPTKFSKGQQSNIVIKDINLQ